MRKKKTAPFPGAPSVLNGGDAVALCESLACGAGAFSLTGPAGPMGSRWERQVGAGRLNSFGRLPRTVRTEDDASALSAQAGLALTGLRTAGFYGSASLLAAHEELFAVAGRGLAAVLHLVSQSAPGHAFNGASGHEAYHALAGSGLFQLFARDGQSAADLGLIAHRVAEQALVSGMVAQDGVTATQLLESMELPERELMAEYLGSPADRIDSPTPAQRILFGPRRRRIPELWSVDGAGATGAGQNAEAFAEGAAGRALYFHQPLGAIIAEAFEEFARLTGRRYEPLGTFEKGDADYLLLGQGSVIPTAEAVAGHLRKSRGIRVGVVDVTLLRPFPGALLGELLKSRKGVAVLERADQPLAGDPPLLSEVRAVLQRCLENGQAGGGQRPNQDYPLYQDIRQAPPLYSVIYGLGGREPGTAELIAAVENMLPQGGQRRRSYLSVSFRRETPASPKQEIYKQTLAGEFPAATTLALAGAGESAPLPKGALALRIHEVVGRELFGGADSLARTLMELKEWRVREYTECARAVRGGPLLRHVAAADEPVNAAAPAAEVDAVLVADPAAFQRGEPLAGLKSGGVLLLDTPLESPEEVWRSLPAAAIEGIRKAKIEVCAIDASGPARGEGGGPAAQWRLAGKILLGAFLATSLFGKASRLEGKKLVKALKELLQARAESGEVGAEQEINPIRQGLDGVRILPPPPDGAGAGQAERSAAPTALPEELKSLAAGPVPAFDLHRFWEETGSAYAAGRAGGNPADPFAASGLLPAGTGLLHDLSAGRGSYPGWLPEKCTGCGACWTLCPDSALPGLVNGIGEILDAARRTVEERGHGVEHLPRALRTLDTKLRELLKQDGGIKPLAEHLPEAIKQTVEAGKLESEAKGELKKQLEQVAGELKGFTLAVTDPFFREPEQSAPGSGGLLSITLDPAHCTGCMACVEACGEEALVPEKQTPEALERQRANRSLWLKLPSTDARYIRHEPEPGAVPGLETLLLNKRAHGAAAGGALGAPGAAERSVLHLLAAAAVAAMQPLVAEHIERVSGLIERLESHIRLRLAVDVEDTGALQRAMSEMGRDDFTLSDLSKKMDPGQTPVDVSWLEHATGLLEELQQLRWFYREGPGGQGRAELGMVHGAGSGGESPVTYPYNPFPFPFGGWPAGGGAAMTLGLFEGHMARMAEGFKAIRLTELELDGKYNPELHKPFFDAFDWRRFDEEEYRLCPPLILAGGDSGSYGAGLGALSALLGEGRPVKVLCLDSLAYRRLLAPAGSDGRRPGGGLAPLRHEPALLAMAHPGTFLLQGSLSDIPHLLGGFMRGLASPRPAIFNIFSPPLPSHGLGDHQAVELSRLAVESRAHPLFLFDPDKGEAPHQCMELEGNPAAETLWPGRTLEYNEGNGSTKKMALPLTFADFAQALEPLGHHFQALPPEGHDEKLLSLVEYLELDAEEREETAPFIWAVGQGGVPQRFVVSDAVVHGCEERAANWQLLQTLARRGAPLVDEESISKQVRTEMAERVWRNLVTLAGEAQAPAAGEAEAGAGSAPAGAEGREGNG